MARIPQRPRNAGPSPEEVARSRIPLIPSKPFHEFSKLPKELQDKIWGFYGEKPKYTRTQLVAVFTEFYTWITSNLLPGNDILKTPPPNGWPGFASGNCPESGKIDFVIEFLRYSPYITALKHDDFHDIHYCSRVRDFSQMSPRDNLDDDDELIDAYLQEIGRSLSERKNIIQITTSHGSYGRLIHLDVIRGEVIVDKVAFGPDVVKDVVEYFAWLKEQYISLEMFKIPGIDLFDHLETFDGEVDEAMVYKQADNYVGTPVDCQYIKQVFREYGWPNSFRKDEALKVFEEFVRRREEDEVSVAA